MAWDDFDSAPVDNGIKGANKGAKYAGTNVYKIPDAYYCISVPVGGYHEIDILEGYGAISVNASSPFFMSLGILKDLPIGGANTKVDNMIFNPQGWVIPLAGLFTKAFIYANPNNNTYFQVSFWTK